ncbi:hypothetical protein ES703_01823 [subsurface metagenome]
MPLPLSMLLFFCSKRSQIVGASILQVTSIKMRSSGVKCLYYRVFSMLLFFCSKRSQIVGASILQVASIGMRSSGVKCLYYRVFDSLGGNGSSGDGVDCFDLRST